MSKNPISMYSPLVEILWEYAGAALLGLLVALLYKVYFTTRVQQKIRNYKNEIVRNHERILELEEQNFKLEKKLKEDQNQIKAENLAIH